MAKEIKTIGVLTSGGDAPGMNAAVRAIVRAGISKGYRMMGIQRGYNGLINGECYEMNVRSVSEIIHRGGTILYTARCLEFKTAAGQAKALARCKELGIDALIVIGGDGSFMGARALANQGIPCVGIPGTIDNDIACSEYTIGYDTAMNTAVEAIDKLRDTTQSHDRCSVVEVMGHHAGYIALNVGIATGALAVLLPERPFDFERDILSRMRQTQVTGKKHFIVIVSEGVVGAQELGQPDPGGHRRGQPRHRPGPHPARRLAHRARPRQRLADGLPRRRPAGQGHLQPRCGCFRRQDRRL